MSNHTEEFLNLRSGVSAALSRSGRGYRMVEGFCGPGGMSLGLQQAGFMLAAAFDIDEPSVAMYLWPMRDG